MKRKKNAPFRFDIVGSFLRPDLLKQARQEYEQDKIDQEQLAKIEDQCIKELIQKQKEVGLSVITDGEFRRSWWHLDFMWGLGGISKAGIGQGYVFHDEITRGETAIVSGKITGKNHPFVNHFKFVKQFEDENTIARQTIPAPAQLYAELTRKENLEETKKIYPEEETLIQDIASAYQTVINDLYEAGCRNIQFDDCTWGMYCDEDFCKTVGLTEENVIEIAKKSVRLNNLAMEKKLDDLVITTHVCRGNYHSTWASQGGYGPIAPYLFGQENVSAYYLEFDDERSGNFEPLKYVSGDKKVVLGLITSKNAKLEEKETILERILEAGMYIPLDRLCLSPQCGFASTEEGNKLTEEEQWNKLRLISEVVKIVWGER